MKRLTDWDKRLNQYMVEAQERAWGDFDCARWVGGAVEAMTGENPHLIDYSDPRSAAQALKDCGAGTLFNYMRRHFGAPIHPAMSKRGDVLEYVSDDGLCLGIRFARKGWFLGEGEFAQIDPLACKRAWTVPFG